MDPNAYSKGTFYKVVTASFPILNIYGKLNWICLATSSNTSHYCRSCKILQNCLCSDNVSKSYAHRENSEVIKKEMEQLGYILIARSGVTDFLLNLLFSVCGFLAPSCCSAVSPSLSPSGSFKPKFKFRSVPPPFLPESRASSSDAWKRSVSLSSWSIYSPKMFWKILKITQ